MKRLLITALLGVCCIPLCLAQAPTPAPLPAKIAKVMKAHRIARDDVSLLVQAVDEDQPRLALNLDTPRNPASTVKLITSWTALDLLGPTHTWQTRIYALGPISNGVLNGDLLIKGYGDPFLVLEDFWKMLGELRRAGVQEINGDLLLDNSAFDVVEQDPAAFDGSGFRLYNTLPAALMVNFQALNFYFRADTAAGKVRIAAEPKLPNLKITNKVKLTSGACRGKAPTIILQQADPADPDHVLFTGDMPLACRNYHIGRSAMTPQSYTYGVFKLLWQQWGGSITGTWREARLSGKRRPLVNWRSRPLAEVLRPLNKWSNNLMTRMLLYTIGTTQYPAPVSRAQGAQALVDHLRSRGFDVDGLVIDNGSGLSRDTRISARLMGDVLRRAWFEPTMPEFVASLAIAGKDGTMRKRFRRGRENGRMHVKTGSIDAVSAIGGYVHTAAGRTFVVTMLANRKGVNYGIGKDLQNAVLAWAFAQQ